MKRRETVGGGTAWSRLDDAPPVVTVWGGTRARARPRTRDQGAGGVAGVSRGSAPAGTSPARVPHVVEWLLVPGRDGTPREVDLLIQETDGPRPVRIAVEYRDDARPAGVDWIEQLAAKYRGLTVDLVVAVAEGAITPAARSRAAACGSTRDDSVWTKSALGVRVVIPGGSGGAAPARCVGPSGADPCRTVRRRPSASPTPHPEFVPMSAISKSAVGLAALGGVLAVACSDAATAPSAASTVSSALLSSAFSSASPGYNYVASSYSASSGSTKPARRDDPPAGWDRRPDRSPNGSL